MPCKDLGGRESFAKADPFPLLCRKIDNIPIITCQLALDIGLHSLCPALPEGIQRSAVMLRCLRPVGRTFLGTRVSLLQGPPLPFKWDGHMVISETSIYIGRLSLAQSSEPNDRP